MDFVLPRWLDQVKGVDFTPEKEILSVLERWAAEDGWDVSDGSTLPSDLRRRTDVLLNQPKKSLQLRISVLPKAKRSPGMIRIDASSHRIFELIYQPKFNRWRVETSAVPLTDDLKQSGWNWLTVFAFRP